MLSAFRLSWSEDLDFGHRQMDDTHREFIDCVNAMLECDDAEFDARLAAFEAHARDHFGAEDRWMAESGYENARCHVDEHKSVLASVNEVQALPDERRLEVGRRLAVELARWFPGHAEAMDHGLATFLIKQRVGGAPIAIKRMAKRG